MWYWHQGRGVLTRDGEIISRGYSGKGRGKNNPALEGIRGLGPIPRGLWRIKNVYNSANVGPYALTLHAVDIKPDDDIHQVTGRSAFRIHGDSIKNPGDASNGCIILPRKIREKIWQSGDRDLMVIE